MNREINPLLAQFANQDILIAEQSAEFFTACLNAVYASADLKKAEEMSASADDFWPEEGSWLSYYRPYKVSNGVLSIPVKGVLLNNFPYAFGSFATGYEYITKAFERGMDDADVKGIALVIDSPGGAVAGNFDLVDKMYAKRGKKPVQAFANESAYSAAYSIASVADSITVSRTGGVGSIGVVTMHVDMSAALEKAGYKVTFIYAGKHKVDGNPYEALPKDVKAKIQGRIDALYDVFVSTVARNRGIDEKAVRDTEAQVYGASEAISIKLADNIGSLDDGLAAFAANINTKEKTTMSKEKEEAVDQSKVDAARAEGLATGKKEGAEAERARVKGIMALDESKDRSAAALNIALNTQLSVDEAKGLLATLPADKAPEAKAENKKEAFEAAMDKTGNPEVGAGDSQGSNQLSDSEQILADYRLATGAKAK